MKLQENFKSRKPFKLFYKNELFAKFEYDATLKRYQSKVGYLTIQDAYKIAIDPTEERKIIWN